MRSNTSFPFEIEAALPSLSAASGKGMIEVAGTVLLWLIEGSNNHRVSCSLAIAKHQLGDLGILSGIQCGLWREEGDQLIIVALENLEKHRKSLSDRGKLGVSQKHQKRQKRSTAAKPQVSRSLAVAQPDDSFIDHSSRIIDHISSLSERSEVPPEPEIPEPDKPKSEHHDLVEKLCDAFAEIRGAKYPFAARDAKVVKDLRATAPPEQILDAWRKALRHVGFPSVGTLAQLQQNLAVFVGISAPVVAQIQPFKNSKTQQEKNLKTGIVGEDLVREKCAVCGDEGHTFAAGKSWLCGEHYQAWRDLADKHKLFDDNDPAVQKFVRMAKESR